MQSNVFVFVSDVVRSMTGATVTPCSMMNAGPSWTTPTLKFTITAVTRLQRRSHVWVSVHQQHSFASSFTPSLSCCLSVFVIQIRTTLVRSSFVSVTGKQLCALPMQVTMKKMPTFPVTAASETQGLRQHWRRCLFKLLKENQCHGFIYSNCFISHM